MRGQPYRTMNRERAVVYLRECLRNQRPAIVNEAVRRGIGASRTSARRVLRWAMMEVEREFDPCLRA
jgi:hypothetical protein